MAFKRQRCINILCPKNSEFYTPLALNCQKGQQYCNRKRGFRFRFRFLNLNGSDGSSSGSVPGPSCKLSRPARVVKSVLQTTALARGIKYRKSEKLKKAVAVSVLSHFCLAKWKSCFGCGIWSSHRGQRLSLSGFIRI